MSVIVKGMEMPKYCYDCPLQDGETGICNILGITVYDIPKECPLIEVVRCKDCAYKQYYFTNDMVRCGCGNGAHHEGFFCANGERRDDGEIL